MSSIGKCFDIGNTIRVALKTYKKTGNPYSGSTDPKSAGNGSLMRIAPVPLFYRDIPKAIMAAEESSKTTHGAEEAIDACRYFVYLLSVALNEKSKENILTNISLLPDNKSMTNKIKELAAGSYKEKRIEEIKGSGYVVESLEAALWAFYYSKSFKDGMLIAVNLGDDADTTGAIYGQLAGAYYGKNEIPNEWIEGLYKSQEIRIVAKRLFDKSIE